MDIKNTKIKRIKLVFPTINQNLLNGRKNQKSLKYTKKLSERYRGQKKINKQKKSLCFKYIKQSSLEGGFESLDYNSSYGGNPNWSYFVGYWNVLTDISMWKNIEWTLQGKKALLDYKMATTKEINKTFGEFFDDENINDYKLIKALNDFVNDISLNNSKNSVWAGNPQIWIEVEKMPKFYSKNHYTDHNDNIIGIREIYGEKSEIIIHMPIDKRYQSTSNFWMSNYSVNNSSVNSMQIADLNHILLGRNSLNKVNKIRWLRMLHNYDFITSIDSNFKNKIKLVNIDNDKIDIEFMGVPIEKQVIHDTEKKRTKNWIKDQLLQIDHNDYWENKKFIRNTVLLSFFTVCISMASIIIVMFK